MRRFLDYSSQLINEESNPIADQFSPLILNHYSISNCIAPKEKSLDKTTLGTEFLPDIKTTIATLNSSQISLLKDVYSILYPTAIVGGPIPVSCRRMQRIEFKGQLYVSSQHILTKSIFPFSTNRCTSRTYFSNADLRVAEIHTFFSLYCVNQIITYNHHVFAEVSWPCFHPQFNYFEPYQSLL